MESGRNLISPKLSCMSSLPARRMIESKMKKLECSQGFSNYKSKGIFQDAQGKLTPQSFVESGPTSRKHLRTKVTPDFHLTYSENGGNLGLESK